MVKVCRVTVDYTRTFDEMVAAGYYDKINSWINQKNFPIFPPAVEPSLIGQTTGEGPYRTSPGVILTKTELVIRTFVEDKEINTAKVLQRMDEMKFCPAPIELLFALGETKPEILGIFPLIVSLGSVYVDSRRKEYVPCFYCFRSQPLHRELGLALRDAEWGSYCHFLVTRKTNQP